MIFFLRDDTIVLFQMLNLVTTDLQLITNSIQHKLQKLLSIELPIFILAENILLKNSAPLNILI